MTNQKTVKYLTNLIILLLLAACTPTERPETSTDSHTWRARPVLITLEDSAGFTDYDYAWALAPDLIVYADGTVIYSIWSHPGNDFTQTYYAAQISNQELCNLLLEIEANGFFDLSKSDYHPPQVTDHGATNIDVNIWRSKSFSAYALNNALRNLHDEEVDVPLGLQDTYELLGNYQPENATPYQPEKIALLVIKVNHPKFANTPEIWPLSEPDIGELTKNVSQIHEIVLEGQEAADVFALFPDVLTKYYEVDGEVFYLTVRPLFPHEIYQEATGWGRLSEFEPTPTTEMTCGA